MGRSWVRGGTESVRRWRVGDVAISKVPELVLEAGLDEADREEGFLSHGTRSALLGIDWLRPDFITEAGEVKLSIHALVVETPSCRIMVDTCVGSDKPRPHHAFWDREDFPFLQSLKTAGYAPDDIDVVVCTHLHVDHVGWNTRWVDGRWLPTFPKARYLFGRVEVERSRREVEEGGDGGLHPAVFMADSIEPVFAAGLAELVETDHVICEEVRLRPTPGHTSGHVSLDIRSGGERALITGDVMHHPVQVKHADWYVAADADVEAARRTREGLLADVSDQPLLVIGSHWAGRSCGQVRRDGGSYRLDPPDDRYA